MRHPVTAALLVATVLPAMARSQHPGYTDTPMLPGGQWHVHDSNRPHPPIVDPGPSTNLPAPVPADAIVLFDGKDLSQWSGAKGDAGWRVQDGYMEVNGTGSIQTRRAFGDCQLHVEWCAPKEVEGESQDRGNSGVYLLSRYEVQVLDSYHNVTYADGQAAALYGQHPPLVNACRKPGEWQSYDIVFTAPRFAKDGALLSPARVTVLHNGILVHNDVAYYGPSGHKVAPHYTPHAAQAPLQLQDHGNPVRYRNIWIRELDLAPAPADAKPK